VARGPGIASFARARPADVSAVVVPGWYGKLPSLGDFASRRLPPLFVEPWDRWLAAGLASWRERDEGWLEAFLAAPTWRFALGAGLPFEQSPGYAGVLMPSVDRVGRYFPLTVARPRGRREAEVPVAWLRALEGVAVGALEGDWSAERLDAELARLDEAAADQPETAPGDGADAGAAAAPAWPRDGRTLWWCERTGETAAPISTTGLPDAAGLARLFAGQVGEPRRSL
jgi:type VI secretion system protein ImpM